MSTEIEHLRKAHKFLLDKHSESRAFTKEDFRRAVDSDEVLERYWSTKLSQLVAKVNDVGPERYLAASAFGQCIDVGKFEQHVLGIRDDEAEYSVSTHLRVINYEFFMPLAHEKKLKLTLDSLFFKDAILKRIESVGLAEVQQHFDKKEAAEQDADYLNRLCGWISDKFGGYSINKVDGRFRMGPLKTARQAAEDAERSSESYLMDETTGVVRFIFKCGEPEAKNFHAYDDYAEPPLEKDCQEIKSDAYLIRYFFWKLFVESIIEPIAGEEEIWLVETGMRSRLHIWRKPKNSTELMTSRRNETPIEEEPWYGWLLRALGVESETKPESKAA